MSYIYVMDEVWPFDQIQSARRDALSQNTTDKKAILLLAHDWLNGQNYFELTTSGSTGKPKVFTFSRAQIKESVQQTVRTFGLEPGNTLLNPLSVDYVAGFMMLMRGLVNKMPVYCFKPSRSPIPETFLRQSFALAAFVPLQIKTLLKEEKQVFLNHIANILIGGGPLSYSLEKSLSQLKTHVYHTYGMTETLTHVAVREIAPERREAYRALPGIGFETDQNKRLIIYTSLWQDPIHTNDRVNLIGTGEFQWLGRTDHIINSGGYKIQVDPAEKAIEEVFEGQWDFIPEFFLTHFPDNNLGEKAVLVVKTEKPVNAHIRDQLIQALKNHLPAYEVPKAIFDLRQFCYTHTGKLDRETTKQMISETAK